MFSAAHTDHRRSWGARPAPRGGKGSGSALALCHLDEGQDSGAPSSGEGAPQLMPTWGQVAHEAPMCFCPGHAGGNGGDAGDGGGGWSQWLQRHRWWEPRDLREASAEGLLGRQALQPARRCRGRPPSQSPPFPIMTGGPERAGPHGSSGGPPAPLGSLPPKTPRGGRGRGHALATPITAATGWGWGGGELRLRPTLSVQVTSCSVQLYSLMTLNTKTLSRSFSTRSRTKFSSKSNGNFLPKGTWSGPLTALRGPQGTPTHR